MKRVDNHSHILFAEIVEMLAGAKRNNVDEFSITEHVSQFREPRESIGFGSVHSRGRIFESFKEYNQEFRKIAGEMSSGMRINRGLEIDYSPRYEDRLADFVNQEEWGMLLCSVHEFEDGNDIERKTVRVGDASLREKSWRVYFELQLRALESDFVHFKVLAHPVRMSRGTSEVPSHIDDLLLDLARTARRRDKFLELNGNDIDYNPELVRRLAIACSKAGCKVSLGSDAHHAKDVFKNMPTAMALVEEFRLEIG